MPNKRRKSKRGASKSRWTLARMLALDSNPSQVIVVKLAGIVDLVSDGSGILSGIATCDPSGGSGSSWTSDEYSAYQDRYSQVRCVGMWCDFTSNLPFDNKEGAAPVVIAPNLLSQAAPTAYASVIDNFGQKTWNAGSDTSRSGIRVSMSHDLKSLGWLPTSAPSAVTGPYAGCPGGIGWYCSGLTASLNFGRVIVRGVYHFRSKS